MAQLVAVPTPIKARKSAGSNPVLTTKIKIKIMEVLIMFSVIAIGFAWVMPQEEIEELDKRLGKKK